MRTASAGTTATVAAGLDLGTVNLSGEPRMIGSNPIKLVPYDSAGTPWKFTGTGNSPALNLTGWSGVWLEGFEAAHDEVGLTANPMGIVKLNNTSYLTVRNANIHGDTSATAHNNIGNLYGVWATGSNHMTVERNKIHHVAWGVADKGNCSNAIIQHNYFPYIQEHAIHQEYGATNCQILYNLMELCTAHWNGTGYDDHGDLYIAFVTGGQTAINGITLTGNMVNQQGEHSGRPQGIFLDNEDFGSGVGSIGNITVQDNILMGGLAAAIFMNVCNAGTNLVSGNECYWETGSTEVSLALIRGEGGYFTFTNNKFDVQPVTGVYSSTGGTFTNGGGNVATTSLSTTQMDAKRDAWRLLHPEVPV